MPGTKRTPQSLALNTLLTGQAYRNYTAAVEGTDTAELNEKLGHLGANMRATARAARVSGDSALADDATATADAINRFRRRWRRAEYTDTDEGYRALEWVEETARHAVRIYGARQPGFAAEVERAVAELGDHDASDPDACRCSGCIEYGRGDDDDAAE